MAQHSRDLDGSVQHNEVRRCNFMIQPAVNVKLTGACSSHHITAAAAALLRFTTVLC